MSDFVIQVCCSSELRASFITAMSRDGVNPTQLSNCRRSVYPGHVMKVGTTNESLSSDTKRHQQNEEFMLQTFQNSSSEIRSRKKSVPLRRGSLDSRAAEQHELSDMDTSPSTSHGHRFISANLSQPTWCDKCGDFIWGVYKQCLICTSMLMLFSYSRG